MSYTTSSFPRAFVIGWPIEHSKSPLIHGYWLEQLGIPGKYEKIAVLPEDLESFVQSLRSGHSSGGYRGGNVTIPHKETVKELVDQLDPAARAIGAVNTLWFDKGSLYGGNTDWLGFAANLDFKAPHWSDCAQTKTAIVIGAGGAARGIVYALCERGFGKIIIANRTIEKAGKLAKDFAGNLQPAALDELPELMSGADFLVNTTNMGMTGSQHMPDSVLEALGQLDSKAVVNDIVYAPLETPLLSAAKKTGHITVDGLGMLLHQAVPGFEKWFGVKPTVSDELREAVLNPQDGTKISKSPKPVVLGLTGSIGMGKSTTAQMFRDEGVAVHDADAVVHNLYAGKAAPLVEAAFPGVVKNGIVDRNLLGPKVIGNPEAMKRLESIIHPLVAEARETFLKAARLRDDSVVVLDIPLLFETGGENHCDHIVVVTASAEEQRRRVLARPEMTEDKFEAILAKQVPDDIKRSKADYIIDTGQGLDAARQQVRDILNQLNRENRTDA